MAHKPKQAAAISTIAIAILIIRHVCAQPMLLLGMVRTLERADASPWATTRDCRRLLGRVCRGKISPKPVHPYAVQWFPLARQQCTWCRLPSSGQMTISSPVSKDSLQRAQPSPRKGDSSSTRMGLIYDRAGIPLSLPQLPTLQQCDISRKHSQTTNYSSILI